MIEGFFQGIKRRIPIKDDDGAFTRSFSISNNEDGFDDNEIIIEMQQTKRMSLSYNSLEGMLQLKTPSSQKYDAYKKYFENMSRIQNLLIPKLMTKDRKIHHVVIIVVVGEEIRPIVEK